MNKVNLSITIIKNDLLNKAYKAKPTVALMLLISTVAAISAVLRIIHPQKIVFRTQNGTFLIIVCAVLVILCSIYIYKYLRIVYLIKHEKYNIISEKLYHKNIELVSYYRKSRIENVLYFKSGKIFVDDIVYKDARIGDEFYLVLIDDKFLYYAYNKKRYKIDN